MSTKRKPGRAPENRGGTGAKKPPPIGRRFQPGVSGNPGGRPKSHGDLRRLIQQLADGKASKRSKKNRLETMLTKMFVSKHTRDRTNILEHGYGKVPQELDLSGDISLLTPEEQDKKRAERWASVAPALAAVLSETLSE